MIDCWQYLAGSLQSASYALFVYGHTRLVWATVLVVSAGRWDHAALCLSVALTQVNISPILLLKHCCYVALWQWTWTWFALPFLAWIELLLESPSPPVMDAVVPVHHSEVVCCVSPSPQYDTFIWYHRNVTWGFIVSECCLAGHLGKALPACVLPRQLVVSLILISPLLSQCTVLVSS